MIEITPTLQARRRSIHDPYELYGALPDLAPLPDPFTSVPLRPLVPVSAEEAQRRAATLKRGRKPNVLEVIGHQGRHLGYLQTVGTEAELALAAEAILAYAARREAPEPAGFWQTGVRLWVPPHLAAELGLAAPPLGEVLEGTFGRVRPYGDTGTGVPCWRPAGVRVTGAEVRWFPEIENLRMAD